MICTNNANVLSNVLTGDGHEGSVCFRVHVDKTKGSYYAYTNKVI